MLQDPLTAQCFDTIIALDMNSWNWAEVKVSSPGHSIPSRSKLCNGACCDTCKVAGAGREATLAPLALCSRAERPQPGALLDLLVCAVVDDAWLPAPGHLTQADCGVLAAQVIFGGAGAAGMLGDLWVFDVFTRYGVREALPPQQKPEQQLWGQLRGPQAHEQSGCTVDPDAV